MPDTTPPTPAEVTAEQDAQFKELTAQLDEVIADVEGIEDDATIEDSPVDEPAAGTPESQPTIADPVAADIPAQDWLTPELSELVETFGIQANQAREFGSVKALNAAIKLLQAAKPAETKQTPAPEPTPAEVAIDLLSEDEYDPGIAKAVNSLIKQNQELTKKLAETTTKLQPVDQFQQDLVHRQVAQETAWFDDQFSKHGATLDSLFGKGTIQEIAKSKEAEKLLGNRGKVADTYRLLTQKFPDEQPEKLFKKALFVEFNDEIQTSNNQQRASALAKQGAKRIGNGNRITKPTVATGTPASDPALIEMFNEFLAAN